jgi:hypothetical protein
VDAIGVCSECGQGVCDSCAVRIAGKLYCKNDADRVFSTFSKEQESKPAMVERPMRVMVSAVILVIYGLIGVGLSVIVILAGFVTGAMQSVMPNDIVTVASIGLIVLGGCLLVMGLLGIVSGWWIYQGKVWGAAVGVVLNGVGIMIITILAAMFHALTLGELAGLIWVGNISIAVLLLSSWNKLQ